MRSTSAGQSADTSLSLRKCLQSPVAANRSARMAAYSGESFGWCLSADSIMRASPGNAPTASVAARLAFSGSAASRYMEHSTLSRPRCSSKRDSSSAVLPSLFSMPACMRTRSADPPFCRCGPIRSCRCAESSSVVQGRLEGPAVVRGESAGPALHEPLQEVRHVLALLVCREPVPGHQLRHGFQRLYEAVRIVLARVVHPVHVLRYRLGHPLVRLCRLGRLAPVPSLPGSAEVPLKAEGFENPSV